MNASISQFLTAGNYVAVVGDYALSLPDVLAQAGNTHNDVWGVKTGDVTLFLGAPYATVVDPDPRALVPEPGTLALIGLGLMLAPVLRRRVNR